MWKPGIVVAGVVGVALAFDISVHAAPHGVTAGTLLDPSPTQSATIPAPEHDHSQPVEPVTSHLGTPPAPAEATPQGSKPGHQPGMMMERHKQMMADMAAADAKLEALLKDMNGATGQAKIDLLAQVVGELARQRRAMREHMEMMPCAGGMMQHK